MKFFADEGVDLQIVARLRDEGHDVWYAAEDIAGTDDEEILSLANQEERILITRDKDFGELAYRDKKVHAGIVLNRLFELSSERKAELVCKVYRHRSGLGNPQPLLRRHILKRMLIDSLKYSQTALA